MQVKYSFLLIVISLTLHVLSAQTTHQVSVEFSSIPDCVTLGVYKEYSIFPNPTTRYVYVPAGSNALLYDVSGSVVKVGRENNKLDLNNLRAGVYFLSLSNGLHTLTHRIIKR